MATNVTKIQAERLLNTIREIGRRDAGLATRLSEELKAHPEESVKIAAEASRHLKRLGGAGASRVGPSIFHGGHVTGMVTKQWLGLAGPKEGTPRADDFRIIQSGLRLLGVV